MGHGRLADLFRIESGDVAEQVRAAITTIANSGPRCEFEIPQPPDPTQLLDPEEVQLVFRPQSGLAEELPRLRAEADYVNSPNGGWVFDSRTDPQSIVVCDCNCNRLGEGLFEIILGCQPRVFDTE